MEKTYIKTQEYVGLDQRAWGLRKHTIWLTSMDKNVTIFSTLYNLFGLKKRSLLLNAEEVQAVYKMLGKHIKATKHIKDKKYMYEVLQK